MSVVSKDTVMKEIFADPELFADLFNGNFFDGNEVIKKEELITEDSASQCSFQWDEEVVELKRIRDLIKKSTSTGSYALLAVENQSSIDSYMPLRCLVYDVCSYLKQINLNKMEELSDLKESRHKKLTPVFTIVLYCGEKRWKKPQCLSECFAIPEQLKDYFQDYRITVVDMGTKEHAPYRNKLMNELFELTHLLTEGNKEQFDRSLVERQYSHPAMRMASLITGSNEIEEKVGKEYQEEKSMCENVKRWIREWKEEGIAQEKSELVMILFQDGLPINQIAKYARITEEEVNRIILTN